MHCGFKCHICMDGKSVYLTNKIANRRLKDATFPMCLLTPFKYLSSSNILTIEYMSRCSIEFQPFSSCSNCIPQRCEAKKMSALGTPKLKHEDFSLAGT